MKKEDESQGKPVDLAFENWLEGFSPVKPSVTAVERMLEPVRQIERRRGIVLWFDDLLEGTVDLFFSGRWSFAMIALLIAGNIMVDGIPTQIPLNAGLRKQAQRSVSEEYVAELAAYTGLEANWIRNSLGIQIDDRKSHFEFLSEESFGS